MSVRFERLAKMRLGNSALAIVLIRMRLFLLYRLRTKKRTETHNALISEVTDR